MSTITPLTWAPSATRAQSEAPPNTVNAWPVNTEWKTWTKTADVFMQERPLDFMQANPIAPNRTAVAQADFAYGGNFMAHGSLDVFQGAVRGTFADRAAALAAAQALKGAGIVGVFRAGDGFDVRELMVSDASRRGPGDDVRSPAPEPRPVPEHLIKLNDVGEPNGSWGHGDYRTLSALRFVNDDLIAFVRGADLVRR